MWCNHGHHTFYVLILYRRGYITCQLHFFCKIIDRHSRFFRTYFHGDDPILHQGCICTNLSFSLTFALTFKTTKEKELDMLNQAYENHSNFMATSTEIWSELQDFTPSVVYHKGSGQTANEQNIGENQENTARSKENGVIQNSAYQAFLSAIQSDNQKLSQQYSGDWKDLRLNLNVSDGDRKMLNGIWDYYANKR